LGSTSNATTVYAQEKPDTCTIAFSNSLNNKADRETTYTKFIVDDLLNQQAFISDVYTKNESNTTSITIGNILNTKADRQFYSYIYIYIYIYTPKPGIKYGTDCSALRI
jgi:hypothetical protein